MRKLILFIAALSWAAVMNAELPASGKTGTCNWTFDAETGVLTISSADDAPEWGGELKLDNPIYSPFAAKNEIKEVIVEEGVSEIGTGAFVSCHNLEKITFPSTLGSIGFSSAEYAAEDQHFLPFIGCTGLKTLIMKSHYAPDYDNGIDFRSSLTFGFDPSKVDLYVYDGSIPNYIEGGWGVFNIRALPAIDEGTFGNGLKWKMSGDGKLTITGQGSMPDYTTYQEQPWAQYVSQITELVVGEGITAIGAANFAFAINMEEAYLPATLVTIGANAFAFTNKLTEITCAATFVPSLGEEALPANDRYVYVWDFMLQDFKDDPAWGVHNLWAFKAKTTYVEAGVEVSAQSDGENSLYINWLQVEGATVYVVTLTAEDGSFEMELTIDTQGHVTSYTRRAPSRAPMNELYEEGEAWKLRVNGLEYGKNYNITILAKDDTQTLATFHTATATVTEADPQGIEEPTSQESRVKSQKKLRDGVLFIERNGKSYNAQGAEMR